MATDFTSPRSRAGDERTKELLRKAWGGVTSFLTAQRGEGMMPPFAPSRETTLGLAGATPGPMPAPRPEEQAAAAVADDREQKDPKGQGASQKGDTGSPDMPLPKFGTGENEGGGRARAIKMPDGRIVMTNRPVDVTDPLASPVSVPYRAPEEMPAGDMASGPEGSVYLAAGAEPTAGPSSGLPQDRSPGWAPSAALNQMYRTGKLSMNARDVADRQRWERGARAGDIEQAMLEAKAKQEIAQAEIDPLEAARIEAEGRYGGQIIEQETMAKRVAAAVQAYSRVTQQMNEAMQKLPDGPEKQQFLDRLERERRDYANIIMGHQLRDPKADPLAALAMGMMTPSGATPEK